jgi:hypothetical protein
MTHNPKVAREQARERRVERSRPLDTSTFSYDPSVVKFITGLYDRLNEHPGSTLPLTEKAYQQNVNVLTKVVMDLFHRHVTTNGQGSIGISLNNNSYKSKSRYNKIGISRTSTRNIVFALKSAGYVYHIYGQRNEKKAHMSRIFADTKFIYELRENGITPDMIDEVEDVEVIELTIKEKRKGQKKRKKKTLLEYADTPETIRMRNELTRYKNFLRQFDIQCSSWTEYTRKDSYKAKRVFSKNFDLGGRLYAGYWQYMPSDHRKNISIEGIPTVEYDYRNCQLKIIYALEGVFYRDDGYMIEGYTDPLGRDLLKKVLLICLNTDSRNKAMQAIRYAVLEDAELKDYVEENSINLHTVIEAFEHKHQNISNYFYRESGLRIQRIDSEICMDIINTFITHDTPVLTVHDSFLVQEQHEEMLQQTAHEAKRVEQFEAHLVRRRRCPLGKSNREYPSYSWPHEPMCLYPL